VTSMATSMVPILDGSHRRGNQIENPTVPITPTPTGWIPSPGSSAGDRGGRSPTELLDVRPASARPGARYVEVGLLSVGPFATHQRRSNLRGERKQ
jgi:hypothetical protein